MRLIPVYHEERSSSIGHVTKKNRSIFQKRKRAAGGKIKKFRSILFKGLWVSRGQSPPLARETDMHAFSRLPKCSCPHCSAQRNSKYCPKPKSALFGSALRGRPLLQVAPSFPTVPRTVGKIHPLPSALRVSVSEVVKKCACRYRVQMRGFAPSIPTPPLKRVRS